MVPRAPGYAMLAEFLEYPIEGYGSRPEECFHDLKDSEAEVASTFASFRDAVQETTTEGLQELYTRTFDINPVCTLEVGWHVYGEDYARGALLVKMRQQLRDNNLPESRELPDHLTHVLALLARLQGEEADGLASRYVLPALGKMIGGLSDVANPYKAVLEAIDQSVRIHFKVEIVAPRERRGDPPGWANRVPQPFANCGSRDNTPSGPGRRGNNDVR